jgi:thioredoxin
MTAPMALAVVLLAGNAAPSIRWEHRYDDAVKKARAAHKPIMIDFWADWCTWCHRLDETTYVDPVVVRLSEEFVALKLDTEGAKKNQEVALRYNVATLPTIAFVTPGGRQILTLKGFQGPGQFPRTMEAARETGLRVMALEQALDGNPRDAAALFGLGVHLFEQEFYEDSRELLYRAIALDADRPVKDRKQARMLIGIIQNYDRKFAEGEQVLKEALGIRPATEYDPKMLFILARLYVSWNKKEASRGALVSLIRDYPDSSVTPKARDLLKSLALESK